MVRNEEGRSSLNISVSGLVTLPDPYSVEEVGEVLEV
jgi:hypothetical protein